MTAVVGLNLGQYVLLAADTRVSSYPPGRPMSFQDEHEKLRYTNAGLITGMGLIQLLDAVKDRLAEEGPTHTDRIVEIIQAERAKVPARWLKDPMLKESVEHETCWMLTYMNCDDINNISPEGLRLRLALAHPTTTTQFLGIRRTPATSGFRQAFPLRRWRPWKPSS